jgi:hypothetical protein
MILRTAPTADVQLRKSGGGVFEIKVDGLLRYTPTPRKSGKTACQPPLRRFCLIDDPPWLPGQLLALRPD